MKSFNTLLTLLPILASASAPNPGTAYKNTLLLDDFNGTAGSAPSSANWILQTGTQYASSQAPPQWGTGEIESYTKARQNIRQVGDGTLTITPRKSKAGQWTSARMETRSDSYQAPARGKMKVESRLKLPAITAAHGDGYWPAFWALGEGLRSNYSAWPSIGEFDIMENVNARALVGQGLHCDKNPGGVCNEPSGLLTESSVSRTGYHTYTMIVDRSVSPEKITWSIDGTVKNTITQNQLGTTIWNKTVHQGIYLVLNVAMGGAFPNAVAGHTTPTSATSAGKPLTVDYVAVWTT